MSGHLHAAAGEVDDDVAQGGARELGLRGLSLYRAEIIYEWTLACNSKRSR